MIEIDSLYKSYDNKEVLQNINLSFKPGEIHGVVGENGAGKTTLFRCISGMNSFKGKINYNKGVIKNVIGFLPTNPYFLSKITGKEYLQLVCNARKIKLTDSKEKNIFDLPLNKYAETYSTGMKKKLALTGILLQNNAIFILDEPFNGVDVHSNIVINQVLLKLKELNKIVILSSHIFSTLHETCDYLHYLKEGRIKKSVDKTDFDSVEQEMKASGIEARIDRLNL
ncbi:ABC transporter ATP-binding protein [Aquimarina sp. AD10]|uniref:ABC transporter ATP-binding protein n=1 Tax=Aquimarina TaxID=290174 RepID=UPI000E555ACE|nr:MULTISPECIES: ABC transporter ATP-binding protein [Aquimarina]AXT63153.1 ABC transporter ATP-binding protein [Aquimarina sp. AD10]RKM98631.1 ATP-binding cassette domain-containing protein [Aquimarina sp. AD10]